MRMGGGARQFGIDAERVPEVLSHFDAASLQFEGFHIFSGSQNLHADTLFEAQRRTIELALRLAKHAPDAVRVLNIGGGFGIPFLSGDKPLDIEAVGAGLAQLIPPIKDLMPAALLVVELGRYIVGEAGIYVSRIVDRKESRGEVFLITDGGLHHHLAASG